MLIRSEDCIAPKVAFSLWQVNRLRGRQNPPSSEVAVSAGGLDILAACCLNVELLVVVFCRIMGLSWKGICFLFRHRSGRKI